MGSMGQCNGQWLMYCESWLIKNGLLHWATSGDPIAGLLQGFASGQTSVPIASSPVGVTPLDQPTMTRILPLVKPASTNKLSG